MKAKCIAYSYYGYDGDTFIRYHDSAPYVTTLVHIHEDEDVGTERMRLELPADVVLSHIQDQLDIIYHEEGYEELTPNEFEGFNTNSLIAWNNALVDSGIIRG